MGPSCLVFELWRQDDNGQKYLVATFSSHQGAETRLKQLTRTLHKQLYWIQERPGANTN